MMPQLRDSGNHGSWQEARRSSQFQGFARIFGVETEYGVSVTGSDHPVDAAQVAMMMFQPVVSRARSTNTYLTNGSRLYLDVGSHPEYATAEARDPMDALLQDLAGERVMAGLALGAQARLRARYGDGVNVHVFKNNADSAGHSFGCHENYLVRRYVPLETVEHELLPFLITRQLYTGAGRVTDQGFEITQRAYYLDEAVSSATTRSRPMVNTRDEPHSDPDEFRRMHVIIGDSNRSQWATWMKLAVTHLIICVIEEAARLGEDSGFASCALADPGAANRAVSADLTCVTARLRLADGSEPVSAVQMQRRYQAVVRDFMERHHDAVDDALPRTDVDQILSAWSLVLDQLEASDVEALSDRVDWAAKYCLFQALKRRKGEVTDAMRERLDMDYHDIVNGSLYPSMLRRGVMRQLATPQQVEHAVSEPPADTRAALRGAFVAKALSTQCRFSCDWTRLSVMAPERSEVVLLDPFEYQANADVQHLMNLL